MAKKATVIESKALSLMKQNRSVEQRADQYSVSIARNIQRDVIDVLMSKIEDIDDQIFELENFSLDTDVNKGVRTMTRDEAEARFKTIIDLEFKRQMLMLELMQKQKTFDKYFGKAEAEL
jgi:hypothetical protein